MLYQVHVAGVLQVKVIMDSECCAVISFSAHSNEVKLRIGYFSLWSGIRTVYPQVGKCYKGIALSTSYPVC